jgi:hypothetical protein
MCCRPERSHFAEEYPSAHANILSLERQLAEARGLPTDGEICHSCGSAVAAVWHARDEEWEAVVGGPGGIRCVRCFAAEAEQKGIHLAFVTVSFEEDWTTDLHEALGKLDAVRELKDISVGEFQKESGLTLEPNNPTLTWYIKRLDRILSKKGGTNDV